MSKIAAGKNEFKSEKEVLEILQRHGITIKYKAVAIFPTSDFMGEEIDIYEALRRIENRRLVFQTDPFSM